MNDIALVDSAIEVVKDESLPIEDRAPSYAILRRLRKTIDQAIRPVGREIQQAMAEAGVDKWGPIRMQWKSVDPRYVCNDPDNWEDDTVQGYLAEWKLDEPRFRQFIRQVPAHLEVDTRAIAAAFASGDPASRDFVRLLDEHRFRVTEGKAASLVVDEPPRKKAA